jgi:hypothetical protein
MWQGEHQMEIAAAKQFGFAVIEPLFFCQCLAFRAMPIPARIISDLLKCTLVALFDMTAKHSSSAYLYMAHNF